MLTFESRKRRGRRTEHATLALLICRVELLAQLQTIRTHAPEIGPMDQQTRERNERRIRMILTVAQLFFEKRPVILRTRVSQCVVVRMIRLNQDSSRSIAASGATRDLRDQLKRSFRGAKVGQGESDVN